MKDLKRQVGCALAGLLGLGGCGSDDVGSPATASVAVVLQLENMRPLDPMREGTYQAWAVAADDSEASAGRFTLPADGRVTVTSPVQDPVGFVITVEPPGDSDGAPSEQKLLGGHFVGATANLSIVGYVTVTSELETDPGAHALFTPSNNPEEPFPSREDAGLWMFGPRPSELVHNNHFLILSRLWPGWTYEGWVIHDFGTPNECWISIGKYSVSEFRLADSRDDTGLGPFSGQQDFVNALPPTIVDMPGEDFISNIFGLPVPCGLELPFDLNGDVSRGIPSRWTHAITIEPAFDKGEELTTQRPFLIQPYRNPIGEGAITVSRIIKFHPELVPAGTATIQR